jgi:AraC-like DNA-binding protein
MNASIFNFHDLVLIITSIGAFLLGVSLILFPKKQKLSSKFLAGFFFCESIRNTLHLFFWHSLLRPISIEHSEFMALIYLTVSLSKGAMLYFYILSILDNSFVLSKQQILHLLASPIAAVVFVFAGFGVVDITSTASVLKTNPVAYFFAAFLHFVPWCYALLCYREISRMNKVLRGFYSSYNESATSSFQLLVYGYIIVWSWQLFTQILARYLSDLQDGSLPNILGLISNYLEFWLLFALYAYSVSKAYSRLAHALDSEVPTIHTAATEAAQTQPVEVRSTRIETGEAASTEHEQSLGIQIHPEFINTSWTCADKIRAVMMDRKIYLDQSINLERFSNQIGERPKEVSYALNTVFKTTFFEFINNYRVEEAKRLLITDSSLSLNDVIDRSGFSSKSAFHRVFKLATQKTPCQFRDEYLHESADA